MATDKILVLVLVIKEPKGVTQKILNEGIILMAMVF